MLIVAIIIIAIVIVMATTGCCSATDKKAPSSSKPSATETTTATTIPTPEPTISFNDTLTEELNEKCSDFAKIVGFDYIEEDKDILIVFYREVWDIEDLGEKLSYESFTIMDVLCDHPEKFDKITLVGQTPLTDEQGYTKTTTVFVAETTMQGALCVNWMGLFNIDWKKALNNFDDVRMNPLIVP